MRNLEPITGIDGIASGGVGRINIPLNRRYHEFKVFMSADNGSPTTDPNDIIDSARILVNGVVIRDLLPQQILDIPLLNGITPGAGELPFYLSCPWRPSITGREATSWDLFGQVSCVIELNFKTGLTALAVRASASYDFARNISDGNLFLAIEKQLRYTKSLGSGQGTITDLPMLYPLSRLHFYPSTGNVSALEVVNDGETVLSGLKADLNDFYGDHGMIPSDSTADLSAIFDYDQQVSSDLKVKNRNLVIKPTCSAGNTMTIVIENRAPGYI